MPIFSRWLVCLFLVWALFQPNKAVGMRHVGGPGLNPDRSPTIRVLYQRENVILMSKTLSEKAHNNTAQLIIVTYTLNPKDLFQPRSADLAP